MCMTVFIASDLPLPTIECLPSNPLVSITPIDRSSYPLKPLLSKQYIVEATYGGCGCGFDYDISEVCSMEHAGISDEHEVQDTRVYQAGVDAVQCLRHYIADLVCNGVVEVYACWYGDWEKPADTQKTVNVDYFGNSESFHFVERELLLVEPSPFHSVNSNTTAAL